MSNMKRSKGTSPLAQAAALGVALATLASGQQALADPVQRAQARRMYDRLTGTPPSTGLLNELEAQLGSNGNNLEATAMFIMDPSSTRSKDFYSVTLKNFASPWTNRDQTIFAPLNDYTATVIGMVRDDEDFREILWQDVLYVGSGSGVPAYSPTSNAHYEALESNNADLRQVLSPTTQSSLNGLPPEATAGVITSRAASEAFFIDGTNRAMFRFTLLNHLCRDLEQIHDTTRPTDRIRQDVTRSPGGDSSVFNNNCVGCHSVMDSMAQAFAYYDFDETAGRLVYTPGQVQPKYLINSDNFKPGFVTPDDAWENRMRLPGQNTFLGWDGTLTGSGNGAKSMGRELANSTAFAQCQVEKVFRTVCFRSPAATDQTLVDSATLQFKSNGDLKRVFARTAAHCAGNGN
ncbi:MAG TPA: hypothetical protein VGD45_09275 [Steroidobacter sp.]|uniref:hypothetical protein n=1 Tax=Steroidobacter sp. TaxID=1978227 RepID=UPI002EDA3A24